MVRHAYSTRKQLAWLADETEVQTLGLPDRPAGNSQQGGLGVKGLTSAPLQYLFQEQQLFSWLP